MHDRMRTFAVTVCAAAVLATSALLDAQDGQAKKPQPKHYLVDSVVATVNDAAIMFSQLRTAAAGRIQTLEQQFGRRLTVEEITAQLQNELKPLINKHAMAQAAKTFGIATPEQVEQYLRDELKRAEAEQLRDLGTHQKVARELQRNNLTWPTYLREQRVDKMSDLADDFAVGMRMQRQSNLYLTPRMLRDTYRENVDKFVHGAAANILVLKFTGPDAQSHAEQAAALWEKQPDLRPNELLAKIPGCKANRFPFSNLDDKSRESHPPALVDFALAGPEGKVSAPMALADGVVVARILDHRPVRNGKFEDPEVQQQLRAIAQNKVINEFRGQALERALARTEVWTNNRGQ